MLAVFASLADAPRVYASPTVTSAGLVDWTVDSDCPSGATAINYSPPSFIGINQYGSDSAPTWASVYASTSGAYPCNTKWNLGLAVSPYMVSNDYVNFTFCNAGTAACSPQSNYSANYVFFVDSLGIWSLASSTTGLFSTEARIIDVVPQYDEVVASTTIGFAVTIFNDSAENVKITLQNMDDGLPAFSGGLSTYYLPTAGYGLQTLYGTTTVRVGYNYGGAVLSGGDSGGLGNLAFPVGFTAVGSSYDNINFPDVVPAIATSTASCNNGNLFQSALCFVFVPSPASINNFSLLASSTHDKIPFAYFYETRDLLLNTSHTASSSLGSLSLNIGSSSSPFPSSVVTMFSPTTLRRFISDNVSNAIRTVTTAGLWIEFLWFLWHRSRSLIRHAHGSSK